VSENKEQNEKNNVNENRVKEGDTVKLHYRGTLDDGSIFDTSEGRMPLEFKIGGHQVISGFEKGVIGLKIGEEKEIVCTPNEAYGDYNEKLVQTVPRKSLENVEKQLKAENKSLETGMLLGMQSPDGRVLYSKLIEITDENVKLDLNHILAGKTLHFKIKIEDIKNQ
jgi:FKBP-type peptidyl-prolyl cis-trans isomerase 2